MWISAILMVNIEDKDMALRMYEEIEIEMSGQSIHGDNLNYSLHHMYLFQTRPCLSLALENRSWCPYQLKRTGLTKPMMLEHIFSPKTSGKYIAILSSSNLGNNHAIGIDCDSYPKMIWDSYEQYSLPLSRDNLSRCCGKDEVFLKIEMMAEIFRTNKKRNKKRKRNCL